MDRTYVAIYAVDGDALREQLEGDKIAAHVVRNLQDMGEVLLSRTVHAVLLDSHIEGFEDRFNYIHTHSPEIPLVVILDYCDLELGARIIRQGAQDWVPRSCLQDTALLRKVLITARIKRATPDGKANSAFIKFLEAQFDSLQTDLTAVNCTLTTVQTGVQSMRTAFDDHMKWHEDHVPLADTLKPVATWAGKHRWSAIGLVVIALVVGLVVGDHLSFFERLIAAYKTLKP